MTTNLSLNVPDFTITYLNRSIDDSFYMTHCDAFGMFENAKTSSYAIKKHIRPMTISIGYEELGRFLVAFGQRIQKYSKSDGNGFK